MRDQRCIDILAIEDDADDAELLRRHLERIPDIEISFSHVLDPTQITKELSRSDVDIIFLDYQLGSENGLEVLERIRSCGFLGSVIALTGHGDENLATQLMRSGADDYVTKSDLDPERLRRAIRNGSAQHAQRLISAQNRKLIAELSNAKRSLEDRNQRLSELYRTAHQFVDDVSHEFRTPLSVVKDFASIVRDGIAGEVNDEQKKYLTIIINRVDDLVTMVGDMLDVSKIEAGKLGVSRRTVALRDIVDRTLPTLERRAANASVRFDVDIPGDLPDVYCDSEKIGRVLMNLVVNAIKFSEDDAGVVKLWAKADPDANEVVLGVTDNGPGIPKSNLMQIFERFRQVDGDFRSNVHGFGLGLSISKQLVQLNLGELDVESVEGTGSTFSFSIPEAEPVSLMERYLRTTWLPRNTASFVSLVSASAEGQDAGSSALVHAYLQSATRHTDLLFGENGSWLLVVAMSDRDAQAIVSRLEEGCGQWNAQNPDEVLPRVRFRSLGTWRIGTNNGDLSRCFRTLWNGRQVSRAVATASTVSAETDPSLDR